MFHGSAYQLSKCTVYSFWILYSLQSIGTIISMVGLVGHSLIFAFGWSITALSALLFAIYLPSLFIYKLHQINQKTMDTNVTPRSARSRSTSKSQSGGTENTSQQKQNTFLILIRKCTILTILSLISSCVVYICGVMRSLLDSDDFNVSVIWGYSIILDVNTNLLCIMLSNTFGHEYYMKILGCVDRCIENNCCKSGQRGVVSELSSYIEGTKTESQPSEIVTTKNDEHKLQLDLDKVSEVP